MSLIPFLISAIASSTLVHGIAVPASQPFVKKAILSPRAPAVLPRGFQVGDLLSFDKDAVLRRDNDSALHELVARYYSDIVDDEINHVVKRADPVWPATVTDPASEDIFDLMDDNIFKC